MGLTKRFFIIALMVCALLPSSCEVDNEDPPPRIPELSETQVIDLLKATGRYDVGEHSCTVEVSTDSYVYPAENDVYDPVPTEVLATMSTKGVMETILEHPGFNPYWFDSYAYLRYHFSTSYSPGLLDEFFIRDDAASVIIERYLGMYYTCADNNYSSVYGKGLTAEARDSREQLQVAFGSIQYIMAQFDILDKATEEEITALSVHVLKTYFSGMEEDYFFSVHSREETIWLAVRIMLHAEYKPFTDAFGNSRFDGGLLGYGARHRAKILLLFNDFIEERL